MKMRVLDLFSGIGGFSLGLERTGGFETAAFCEIEDFPRRVLAKHWPEVPCYDDVRTLTASRLAADGIAGIDVITGGFPCQDLSIAGKQAGMGAGTRSGLWSEIVRLIGEIRPRYVIVENVAALLSGPSERRGGWFCRVLGDLAECGYDAEWRNIPAFMVGAPHRRERIWIVARATSRRHLADANENDAGRQANSWLGPFTEQGSKGLEKRRHPNVAHAANMLGNGGDDDAGKRLGAWPLSKLGNDGRTVFVADAYGIHEQGQQPSGFDAQGRARQVTRQAGPLSASVRVQWLPEPGVGRVANGIPDRAHRLAALGNAVVPQIPELIGRAILAAEKEAA